MIMQNTTTRLELSTMMQTIKLEYEVVHKCMRIVIEVSQMIPQAEAINSARGIKTTLYKRLVRQREKENNCRAEWSNNSGSHAAKELTGVYGTIFTYYYTKNNLKNKLFVDSITYL